jgi:hypothetical protein
MGLMRFLVPSRESLPGGAFESAYLAGLEGIPCRARLTWVSEPGVHPQEFVLERTESESGNLSIAWQVPNQGQLVLTTGSLRERPEPYRLPVELARGAVYHLRQQLADWESQGFVASTTLKSQVRETEVLFRTCVIGCRCFAESSARADQVMEQSLRLGDILVEEYAEQVLAIRHQQEPQLATLFGVTLDGPLLVPAQAQRVLQVSNSIALDCCWRKLEPQAGRFDWELLDQGLQWCRQHKLRVLSGPLLSNSARHLPDWLTLWAEDCEAVLEYLLQYIRQVVSRYRGAVNVWNCAARLNVPGMLPTSDEETLRLLVGTIEEVRRLDPDTPAIVCFDQPWAEFLAEDPLACSPLHLADSLIRADLGLAGIGLELNLGYWPHGTLPRDPLDISSQIDRWSVLGIPLVLYLAVPSGSPQPVHRASSSHARVDSESSSHGTADTDLLTPNTTNPLSVPSGVSSFGAKTLVNGFQGGSSPEAQAAFLQKLVPLLLSKPMVQGLVWNQTFDTGFPEYPTAGLFDRLGQPKPALTQLAAIRQAHLT